MKHLWGFIGRWKIVALFLFLLVALGFDDIHQITGEDSEHFMSSMRNTRGYAEAERGNSLQSPPANSLFSLAELRGVQNTQELVILLLIKALFVLIPVLFLKKFPKFAIFVVIAVIVAFFLGRKNSRAESFSAPLQYENFPQ